MMHPCEKCLEIQSQIKNRLQLYGYEDMRKYPEYKEDILNEIIRHCYCEKLGTSKIWWTNSNGCEDSKALNKCRKSQHSNKKKHNKRERDIRYKRRLAKNAELHHGVYFKDGKFVRGKGYVPVDKPYYDKYYRGSRSKYLKKLSHKIVRRYKGALPRKGNQSNKLFDFWWELD